MLPHERSLVADLKDKPFALIGVNSDPDLDMFHAEAKKNGVTWRSFWCGPKGAGGPIPTRWQISGWPSIFVLDHKGVIRFRDLRGDALTGAVELLLVEQAKEQQAGKK